MTRTQNMTRNAAFGLLAAGFLVACDNANGNVVSQGIASLGSDFVNAFNRDPNATPVDRKSVV